MPSVKPPKIKPKGVLAWALVSVPQGGLIRTHRTLDEARNDLRCISFGKRYRIARVMITEIKKK